MSRTISVRFNKDEIKKIVKNYDITEDEISKIAKQVILDPDSVMFSQKKNKRITPENIIETGSLEEVESAIKDFSIDDLKKSLGIGKEQANKIDQNGLYFEENLESYIRKFLQHWHNSFEKVPELIARISMIARRELLVREYTGRIDKL